MPCQIILKWSRQMTKFIKQTRASNKAKTRRKTKVNLLSLEQELDISECFFLQEFQAAHKDCSLQYT
jgi:hypothetical protein